MPERDIITGESWRNIHSRVVGKVVAYSWQPEHRTVTLLIQGQLQDETEADLRAFWEYMPTEAS